MNADAWKQLMTIFLPLLWSLASSADAPLPASAEVWPNTLVARLEASLLLQTLNAELLSHDSATLTLEQWCGAHHLATPPRIHAERVTGVDKPVTEEQRHELGVSPSVPVRYRRVKLLCGTAELSEADNWYVPRAAHG